MTATRLFGSPTYQNIKLAQEAGFHKENMYLAVLDASALWDLSVLDLIIKGFPSRRLDESSLFLVLCECIANAAMHGDAAALGFYARQRDDVLLLSFFQAPPMDEMVAAVLQMARQGALPDYTCDLPGGLGFPILLRLAHQVTINAERTKLHLWFRFKAKKKLSLLFTGLKRPPLAKRMIRHRRKRAA